MERRHDLISNTVTMTAPVRYDGADDGLSRKTYGGVKVTIHIPHKVEANARQQKINRIYDLLKPKTA